MLSQYVVPGNKMEIQVVNEESIKMLKKSGGEKKVYRTQVADILAEDRLEILVPIEKLKLILLPINAELDLYFYTSAGLLQCFGTVIDRYKNSRQYILLVELTSNLRKVQRRNYYRLDTLLEMNVRLLEKEEIEAVEKQKNYLMPGLPLKKSVIVNISGTGIRYRADYAYEPDSMVYCKFNLVTDRKSKEYTLLAKIRAVRELEDRPGTFEHRAQFINIDTEEREGIIRFIFDEERKRRKQEKQEKSDEND